VVPGSTPGPRRYRDEQKHERNFHCRGAGFDPEFFAQLHDPDGTFRPAGICPTCEEGENKIVLHPVYSSAVSRNLSLILLNEI